MTKGVSPRKEWRLIMKRKLAALCLALCLAFTMAGCGGAAEEGEAGAAEDAADAASEVLKAVDVDDLSKYMTLGEYKGLETTKTVYEVTEEDVDYQIESTLSYAAEPVTDRPIQEGDIANIDYVGTMDGVEFEGGAGSNFDLTIGSQTFIEGFEEGLIGASAGDKVDVNVVFPDPYLNNPDYSGKPAVFHVTVNTIYAVPELTDEWVQENTDSATVDEYRAKVKDAIAANNGEQADYEVKTALFEQVMANCEFIEYPQELMDAEVEAYKNQIEAVYAVSAGMTLDDFITAQGMTVEEFESICQQGAQVRLQQKMIIQGIMDAEGLEITQGEYESLLGEYATFYGFEDVDSMIATYGEDMIKFNILWDKTCELLMDHAVITEVDSGAELEVPEETTEAVEEEATESVEEETTEEAAE